MNEKRAATGAALISLLGLFYLDTWYDLNPINNDVAILIGTLSELVTVQVGVYRLCGSSPSVSLKVVRGNEIVHVFELDVRSCAVVEHAVGHRRTKDGPVTDAVEECPVTCTRSFADLHSVDTVVETAPFDDRVPAPAFYVHRTVSIEVTVVYFHVVELIEVQVTFPAA